jgi:hypothetical protein
MKTLPTSEGWAPRRVRRYGLLLAALLLGACGGERLSGHYADPRGVTDYEFRPDGRVFISVMGTTTLASYRLLDDRVVIDGPEGSTVLRRNAEELEGPLGLRLIRATTAPVRGDS